MFARNDVGRACRRWAAGTALAAASMLMAAGDEPSFEHEAVALLLDRQVLRERGWELTWRSEASALRGDAEGISDIRRGTLSFHPQTPRLVQRMSLRFDGTALLIRERERVILRELSIEYDSGCGTSAGAEPKCESGWRMEAADDDGTRRFTAFRLTDVIIAAEPNGEFRLSGTVASADGRIAAEGTELGTFTAHGHIAPVEEQEAGEQRDYQPPAVSRRTAGTIGTDVIVGDLHDAAAHGSTGGVTAFSIGTTSCNIGDAPLKWFANTNQHPVIAQNLYRLKDGRFEQLGLSWLKHGFYALSEYRCFSDCQPTNGTYLGVHCSDPYSAYLNGQQANLGPRYQVNAHTGFFNYPPANPAYSGALARRIQVLNSDLAAAQNPGALYFAEGQYVTADDSAAGNQNNNASFRPVSVFPNGSSFALSLTGSTRRQKPAIRAWRENDPYVVEADVQVPDDGLFIVAGKATELGGGQWQYEYAVQNLNSHRSARSFSIPIDPTATITNIGFRDVNYHSGEPFSPQDWIWFISGGSITWTTDDYNVNQNANALRWGTLYNFRFTMNRQPFNSAVTLGLFRPGTPTSANGSMVGPITSQADCNENGVPDSIDIQDQTSEDCDGDLIPDECESFPATAIPVAEGLDRPVYVTAPTGDSRLFIVEQSGRIKILAGNTVLPTPYLDISSIVSSTGERGLLSMAFHPAYASNGFFYVNYTDLNGDTVIARYLVSGNTNIANPDSAVVLKTISQDLANHNGGQLQFGPDGFLYAGLGDGGGNYDPFNRAQDTGSLLGKILRLDVTAAPTYVPESNPFVGSGLPLDEIWAIGTRNPWRFSFDRQTGDLYIADVGESGREEVNFQPAGNAGGRNYGWRCMEGTSCTGLSGCTCNSPSLTPPVFEYVHSGSDCSITGGYVYRGCAIPNLQGAYLYADYCSGRVGSFRVVGGTATDFQDLTAQVTSDTGPIPSIVSFGENSDGELFLVSHAGTVYRLLPDPDGGAVCGNNVLEPGEFCDDGNVDPGDGCDENCAIETGPPNDRCIAPLVIGDGTYVFDTNGAGRDGPADGGGCNPDPEGLGSDIWYCYTPQRSGMATVSACQGDFNSNIAVYEGCQCPTASSQIACNENACGQFGTGSVVSFPATACSSYLIRLGGSMGDQGAGELDVECTPPALVADCDGNGIEDTDDILCGTQHDSNGNQIPDTCETDGDYVRGGRLYDQWWIEASLAAPTEDHPLWAMRPDQTSNLATGATTWRCKECHGWDYKGVDGQCASGSHRTGFPGILGTTLDAASLFELLKQAPLDGGRPGLANGHDYGSVLPDTRINDLVAFVLLGAIDGDPYISPATAAFNGDPVAGETNYVAGPSPTCTTCHGADGTSINFGTPQYPEYLGTIANNNPWELLHKVRFGQPGAPMPSWVANGGSTSGATDIGRYIQLEFPTDCTLPQHCDDGISCTLDECNADGRCVHTPDDSACSDDGVFCTGPEVCDPAFGCGSAGNPCSDPAECVEVMQECGCLPPTLSPVGNRYLAITPRPENADFAMAFVVTPQCVAGVAKYVGSPTGPYNVAPLMDDPAQAAYLTAAQWGGTVYVMGTDIAPEIEYAVHADCGLPDQPVTTATSVITMPVWGDVTGPPGGGLDGVANVLDIAAVVNGVLERPDALPMYRLDLYGCSPNQRVDVIDIAGVVDAVKEYDYRSGTCSGPCW